MSRIHQLKFYLLSNDEKGKYLLKKGDTAKEKHRIGKAIDYYKEAEKYCNDEAQIRLENTIPSLSSNNKKNKDSNPPNLIQHAQSVQKIETPPKKDLAPKKFMFNGPYFPMPPPVLSDKLIPLSDESTNFPMEDAPSTLALANMYNKADIEEKKKIMIMIEKIIQQFDENSRSEESIQELSVLAAIPEQHIFIAIITQFLKIETNSQTFPEFTLHGLAVILTSAPKEVSLEERQGVLIDILVPLQHRLERTRTASNNDELIPLLRAIAALFDAMLCRSARQISRVDMFNPLILQLEGLASDDGVDLEVSFLARYAIQTLSYIGNDESFKMRIFRRGRLAIGVIDDLKSGVLDLSLEKFESAYEKIMSMSDFVIKMEWYQGLLFVDCLLASDDLQKFESYVVGCNLNTNEYFMQGICFRLERVASSHLTHVASGAQKLLRDLESYPNSKVQATAQMVLNRLRATTKYRPAPAWDKFWYSDTKSYLLGAVKKRMKMDSNMLTIDSTLSAFNSDLKRILPTSCSMTDVNQALLKYYSSQLTVRRVSGEILPIESCYINLAIVEASSQRKKEKEDLQEQTEKFIRMPSFEDVVSTNTEKPIPINEILDKRKLISGEEGVPKRVLIIGRAGIGKTTFCKKLIHIFQAGQWNDRFDAILWLPLRLLKLCSSRTLEGLLLEKYFLDGIENQRKGLAQELIKSANNGRVLFILDGLDEFVTGADTEEGDPLRSFVMSLLNQPNIIVTTRPNGNDRSLIQKLDLELETIGFSSKNVEHYVKSVVQDPNDSKAVLDFIQQTPLIQGIVNIPIQLDLICFVWNELDPDEEFTTITQLYQAIVRKLWCSDAVRMKKMIENKLATPGFVQDLDPEDIDEHMKPTTEFAGYLSYQGLKEDHRLIFNQKTLKNTLQEFNQYKRKTGQSRLQADFLGEIKSSSVLHKIDGEEAWSFLHLTFQEYFAATWLAQYFQPSCNNPKQLNKDEIISFIKRNKYNPRFEIVWWMLAGQLEGKALESYFELLQTSPRDLIGVRHQILVAGCYKESSSRLSDEISKQIQTELDQWLRFELEYPDYLHMGSLLGRHSVFPEEILISNLGRSVKYDRKILLSLCHRKNLKPQSIKEVIQRTKGNDILVTTYALKVLASQLSISEPSETAIMSSFKHKNSKIRAVAAKAFSNIPAISESMTAALLTSLSDPEWNVRFESVKALGSQSMLSDSTKAALVSAIQDKRWGVRENAVIAISNQSTLSESMLTELVKSLHDDEDFIRKFAVIALGNHSTLSESIMIEVIMALQDDKAHVRKEAATAIGKQASLSELALAALVAAMSDGEDQVKLAVVKALDNQSTFPESAITAIIPCLRSENSDLSTIVGNVLCNHTKLSKSSMSELVAVLQAGDHIAKFAATRTLRNRPTLPKSTMDALSSTLQDEEWYIRGEAVNTLGSQSTLPEFAVRSLVRALHDKDSYVRRTAANALGNQSKLYESTILELTGALQDEDRCVRCVAATALGNQSFLPDSAILALTKALQDAQSEVRLAVAKALSNQSSLPESSVMRLITALRDDYQDVRISAAKALSGQTRLSGSAVKLIVAELSNEAWEVRSAAATAFIDMQTLPESAKEPLFALFKDDDWETKNAAALALGKKPTLSEPELALITKSLSDDAERLDLFGTLGNRRMYLTVKDLAADEIEMVYKNDFFIDSCSLHVSLTIHDNRLQVYTEQGLGQSDELSSEVLDKVKNAFLTIQKSNGIENTSF